MSTAAPPSRGLKFGAEPRKLALLGGLLVVAVGAFLYNSSSDTGSSDAGSSAAVHTPGVPASATPLTRPRIRRRAAQRTSERNTLRMQEVTLEAQRGNIDPTLRLDLLQRLKGVKFTGGNRSLFESGPAAALPGQAGGQSVKITPGPLPQTPANTVINASGPLQPQFAPIPLKFYGFAAPANSMGPRRGFFLDDDNVVVADEGDTVKGHYRIVSLQPKAAEVEDTATKNRQTLTIIPESQPNAF